MTFRILAVILLLLTTFSLAHATEQAVLEQSVSATLDLWREGRFEQLFEHLAHRGKTSREHFVKQMSETSIRPACCFQKMENFQVLNEKRSEATVYLKVGLEGTPSPTESCTREFKLTHEAGEWKMQLKDVTGLAGIGAKKHKSGYHRKKK